MEGVRGIVVFDTGPVLHFVAQGWLGILRLVVQERSLVVPESVERELRDLGSPHLLLASGTNPFSVDRRNDAAYLAAFARYEGRLVAGGKNRGECGVLALGAVMARQQRDDYILVIDDRMARNLAQEDNLHFTTTLALLIDAIKLRLLTVDLVEALADDLLSGDYYLPFGPGGFRRWAIEEGHWTTDECLAIDSPHGIRGCPLQREVCLARSIGPASSGAIRPEPRCVADLAKSQFSERRAPPTPGRVLFQSHSAPGSQPLGRRLARPEEVARVINERAQHHITRVSIEAPVTSGWTILAACGGSGRHHET